MKDPFVGYASAQDRKEIPLGWYALTTLAYAGLATLAVRAAKPKEAQAFDSRARAIWNGRA